MADSPFWPSRQRGRAAMGLPNDNMQQIAQMLLKGNETAQTPPYIHPQAAANIGANIGTGIGGAVGGGSAPPPTPPVTVQATPPPVTGPGDQLPMAQSPDQSLPPMPPPTHIGGPSTPGFWERFNKAIASGQVPEGYRGVMGELIKNG